MYISRNIKKYPVSRQRDRQSALNADGFQQVYELLALESVRGGLACCVGRWARVHRL